jgi:hypothetical protein
VGKSSETTGKNQLHTVALVQPIKKDETQVPSLTPVSGCELSHPVTFWNGDSQNMRCNADTGDTQRALKKMGLIKPNKKTAPRLNRRSCTDRKTDRTDENVTMHELENS